jgi:hypothetical protein
MLSIIVGVASVICDCLRWLSFTLRSTSAVEAENLFLRRQLALYVERGVKARRIDSITRIHFDAPSVRSSRDSDPRSNQRPPD